MAVTPVTLRKPSRREFAAFSQSEMCGFRRQTTIISAKPHGWRHGLDEQVLKDVFRLGVPEENTRHGDAGLFQVKLLTELANS